MLQQYFSVASPAIGWAVRQYTQYQTKSVMDPVHIKMVSYKLLGLLTETWVTSIVLHFGSVNESII